MKKLALILGFLFFAISSVIAGDDEISRAEKAYDGKKYKDAITIYEKLIRDGYKAYELYFNLGNAYYKNGDLGRAIYYYELARKIEPNDEDVRINLGIANSKTIDRISSRENFFVNAVKTNILTMLNTSQWAWFGIILLTLAAVLVFLYIIAEKFLAKRISLSLAGLCFVLFVIVYFLGFSALRVKSTNKFAIVLAKEVRIMNEPNATALPKFSLHEGTRIRVIESNGDWVLISLDNGNEGWVRNDDVGII